MGEQLVPRGHQPFAGANIYADRSSLVLDWLLRVGIKKDNFGLREVSRECKLSVGLVQRVFRVLVLEGWLETHGARTAKYFSVKKSGALLDSWLEWYNIVKKCNLWAYRSALSSRDTLLERLKQPHIQSKVALALHSAAEAYGCKNTNLDTLELYMLDHSVKRDLEKTLELEPQERGYEVLLITPYYKSLLNLEIGMQRGLLVSSPLLTFLDLYHFPLRGQEQAEFMIGRIPQLKHIYKKDSHAT